MSGRGAVEEGGEWVSHRITHSGEGDDRRTFAVTETWQLVERKRVQVDGPRPERRKRG